MKPESLVGVIYVNNVTNHYCEFLCPIIRARREITELAALSAATIAKPFSFPKFTIYKHVSVAEREFYFELELMIKSDEYSLSMRDDGFSPKKAPYASWATLIASAADLLEEFTIVSR